MQLGEELIKHTTGILSLCNYRSYDLELTSILNFTTACLATYTKVGCFKDDMRSPRPLPELLFTDRDPSAAKYSKIPIDWKNWNFYIKDLVCRCAKEAKLRNFAYFSIQFYG